LGAFRFAFPFFQPADGSIRGIVEHSHGDWLELLATGGAVALGIFLLGVGLQLVRGASAWARWTDPEMRWLSGGALAATLSLLIHGMMEMSFQSPSTAGIFIVLVCAVPRMGDEQPGEPGSSGLWKRLVRKWGGITLVLACALPLATVISSWSASKAGGEDLGARAGLLDRALRFDPGNPWLAYGKGVTQLWLGEDAGVGRLLFARRALQAADEGLADTPDNANLLELKGTAMAWLRMKGWKETLERADALKPWKKEPKKRDKGLFKGPKPR
jgi:hypothetical protein